MPSGTIRRVLHADQPISTSESSTPSSASARPSRTVSSSTFTPPLLEQLEPRCLGLRRRLGLLHHALLHDANRPRSVLSPPDPIRSDLLEDDDHVHLAGLAVGDEGVEAGAVPLAAGDAHVDVDVVLGDVPPALVGDGAQLVELEADVLAVVGGGDAGVEGGPRGPGRGGRHLGGPPSHLRAAVTKLNTTFSPRSWNRSAKSVGVRGMGAGRGSKTR
jgi:hypothetical protein